MANPRFDRSPPERDPTRINERIRVSEVRLIDEEGNQVGIVPTDQALALASERDLDLVEVAPDARPPVARLLDYSKYRYEQEPLQEGRNMSMLLAPVRAKGTDAERSAA